MKFWDMVATELQVAKASYPPARSFHEAYGIMLEEVEELWEEVKRKHKLRDSAAILEEAVQVAAMSQRTAQDLLPDQGGPDGTEYGFAEEARFKAEAAKKVCSVVEGVVLIKASLDDFWNDLRWGLHSRSQAWVNLVIMAAWAQRLAEDCGLLTLACPETEQAVARMLEEDCPHG